MVFVKIENWFVKYRNELYIVLFSVYFFTMFFSNTALIEESIYSYGNIIYRILKYIKYLTYLDFLCIVIYDFYKGHIKRLPVIGVLLFSGLSTLLTRDFQVVSFALVVIAAAEVSKNKILKWYMIVSFTLLAIVLFASSTGMIANVVFDLGTRNRNTLGFLWTTSAPIFFFFTVLVILYCYHKKLSWIELLSLWVIGVLLFQLTNTKFVFILTGVVLLLEVLFARYEDKIYKIFENKWIIRIIYCIPGVCCLFSILSAVLYNPDGRIWQSLNALLTNRLINGKNAIVQYGFSFFGQPIEWKGSWIGAEATDIYNYVDSSFLQIALKDGIIIALIALVAYTGILYWLMKKKSYWLAVLVIVVLVICITEPRLINVSYNPFLILAAVLVRNHGTRRPIDFKRWKRKNGSID